MNLVYSFVKGELAAALLDMQKPIAEAGTMAIAEVGDVAVIDGRREIAAAGFSKSFQNDFVSQTYPRNGKPSLRAAVAIRHKVNYARVYEEGAQIAGKPLLWLPLDTVPLGDGGRKLTPKQYVQRIGPLVSVNKGKTPLLVGKAGRKTILRATKKQTRVRKGAFGNVFGANIPLFVGVDSVRLRKRFGLYAVIEKAAGRMVEFYNKHLKD